MKQYIHILITAIFLWFVCTSVLITWISVEQAQIKYNMENSCIDTEITKGIERSKIKRTNGSCEVVK